MPIKTLPYDNLDTLIKNNLSTQEHVPTQELIDFLKTAKKRKYLEKEELEKICRWKSPRAIQLIKSNSEKDIFTTTKEAFATRSERSKMEILTRLNGVSYPMASAILMLLNPKRYGVIDIRVWEMFYHLKLVTTNPKGTNFKWNEWYRYLVLLRYYAKKYNVKARDIERTIFIVHKEFQVGNLYLTPKSPILK